MDQFMIRTKRLMSTSIENKAWAPTFNAPTFNSATTGTNCNISDSDVTTQKVSVIVQF
ncbi:hypothetical protein OROGR_026948 [Orobanche gracilis]